MVYVIKQVGKDLYFRCTAEGYDWVSFGEASISRYDMTISTTMDRLRRDEERRQKLSNRHHEKLEFEVLSFSDEDISRFSKMIKSRR
jgi:hypothetical protein